MATELSNIEIIESIGNTGMIPVFNHRNADVAKHIIEAAYKAGVRVFEFTNRQDNAGEIFDQIQPFTHDLPGAILGIGTIWNGAQAKEFIERGASFIVSPILDKETANTCKSMGKLWFPGCATFTEIIQAKRLGAEIVKVFPGSVLGPGFVSSVLSVAPDLKIMPTGGVEPTKENLNAWFGAGVYCVGMGSKLFKKELISQGNWKALEAEISDALKLVNELNQK